MPSLLQRYSLQCRKIKSLENKHQLDERSVRLIAVSKTRSSEEIACLYRAGQQDFGENYLQDALPKQRALTHLAIYWHFIGPIQSNKTRDVARYFQWVHSVERLKIAQRLAQQRPSFLPKLNICLQVNVDEESRKSGFLIDELEEVIEPILSLKGLKLRGLMAIPRATSKIDEQRKSFRRLAAAKSQINAKFGLQLDTLSMGMSSDLSSAIAEGATMVRVGTAIFGQRQKSVQK
ncbi:MAG: YggS family pyridoxal phosphate enzyme [Cycloclasticus sp. symbiont of Poecilosclerida sp. M]|nr:MAG: YggS family pyridoxal phosphate enzyme [Cycloclasticus sp. symbiont of Poecilosclerida sp. M]